VRTSQTLLAGAGTSPWLAASPELGNEARRWAQVLGPARRLVEQEAARAIGRRWPPIQRATQHLAAMQAAQLRWGVRQLSSLDRVFEPVVDPVAWFAQRGSELLGAQLMALGPSAEDLAWLLSQGGGALPHTLVDAFQARPAGSGPLAPARLEAMVQRAYGGWMPFVDPRALTASPVTVLHRAELGDGTPVLVRALRPGMRSRLLDDARLLAVSLRTVERTFPPLRASRPVRLAQLIARQGLEATDLRHDALNTVVLGLALEALDVPPGAILRPVPDGFDPSACVYEAAPGSAPLAASVDLVDVDEAVRTLMAVTFEAALDHGVFHADLRPESILVEAEGHLVLAGCPVLGRLDDRSRRGLAELVIGVLGGDLDQQMAALEHLGMVTERTDVAALRKDWSELVALNPLALMSGSGLPRLRNVIGVVLRHGLTPPVEVLLLGRSLLAVYALLRYIAPDRSAQQLFLPMLPRLLGLGPRLQSVVEGDGEGAADDQAATGP
jgi:ubiquinone biosynthesis protein